MTDMNKINEQELENIAGGAGRTTAGERSAEFRADTWQSEPLPQRNMRMRSTTSACITATRFRSPAAMCRALASAAAQPPTFGYLPRSSVFPDM